MQLIKHRTLSFHNPEDSPIKCKNMASGDIQEDQMTITNTVDYLRGLKGKDSVLVSPVELLGLVFQGKGNVSSNIDNYTKTGFYGMNDSVYKTGVISYGMLLVFSGVNVAEAAGGNPIVQIAINGYHPAVAMKVRVRWESTWSEWKSITLT